MLTPPPKFYGQKMLILHSKTEVVVSKQIAQNAALRKWKFCTPKMENFPNAMESRLFRDFPCLIGQFRDHRILEELILRQLLAVQKAIGFSISPLTAQLKNFGADSVSYMMLHHDSLIHLT